MRIKILFNTMDFVKKTNVSELSRRDPAQASILVHMSDQLSNIICWLLLYP
jgi:hypothetical protein